MELGSPFNVKDAQSLDEAGDLFGRFSVSLLEGGQDRVEVLDANGHLTFMSRNGLKALEISSFEAVRGAPWPSLWPAEHRALIDRAVETARQGNTAEFEAVCPTMSGVTKVWSVLLVPVLSKGGQIDRIVASSRDVTARVTREQATRDKVRALERELAEAKEALTRRDHQVADMDHRVKNSLSLVSTMLRLQKRDVTDPEAGQSLDAAASRVMAIARVHEGLQERSEERLINADTFVSKLIDDLNEAIGATPPVDVTVEPDLQIAAHKGSHLGLIVVELVQNARKHSSGTDVPITLSLAKAAASDVPEQVELCIADQGPGLPEGFDVLRNGGLGLKLCASGAAMLGGELNVLDRDVGTAFAVRFPPL